MPVLTLCYDSYEDAGYQASQLSKVGLNRSRSNSELIVRQMTFLLNGKPVDALALIVHKSAEQEVGRAWVKKLCAWHS